MTRENVTGEGIMASCATLGSHRPTPEDRLYSDGMSPTARPRSFLGDIADAVITGVIDTGKAIAERELPQARARSHPIDGFYVPPSADTEGYGDAEYIAGYIDPRTIAVSREGLGNILRKYGNAVKGVISGVSVDKGEEDEGIYADIDLLEKAGRYVRTRAEKYLSPFINALITVGKPAGKDEASHEGAHHDLGVKDEPTAERYGVANVLEIARRNPLVGEAVKMYRRNNDSLDLAA